MLQYSCSARSCSSLATNDHHRARAATAEATSSSVSPALRKRSLPRLASGATRNPGASINRQTMALWVLKPGSRDFVHERTGVEAPTSTQSSSLAEVLPRWVSTSIGTPALYGQ